VIRVLLVDDDAEVRESLRLIVESEPDMVVVAEVATGERAVASARSLRVDVAVVDVQMPGIDGIETTTRLRALPTPPSVLVLTAFAPGEATFGALEAGAAGFLLKSFRPHELPAAVRDVAAGRQVLAPDVTAAVVAEAVRARREPEPPPPGPCDLDDDLHDLTPRERDLARALGLGLTNAQIALELGVTTTSAKTYVSRLLEKLGLQNRTQVAVLAHRAGLV